MHYIYSLNCKDGYYVGCSDTIQNRLERHQKGQVSATAGRLPIKLEFYFVTENKHKAFEFEKYLKSGSGRAFLKKQGFEYCVVKPTHRNLLGKRVVALSSAIHAIMEPY